MPRHVPRHDRDAGGPADVLAAKASLREEVWAAMSAARVARFPGAAGRIPNFTGAEAAAEQLRGLPEWQQARTLKANPDLPQLPVRQRALEDGKTVYMAVPRLAETAPFFALDPDHLSEPPRKAASITGAARSARRVSLADLAPVDLVVMGSVAVGEDGARLGKGGGYSDLEYAIAWEAGAGRALPMSSIGLPASMVSRAARLGCSSDCAARRSSFRSSWVISDKVNSEGPMFLLANQDGRCFSVHSKSV